MRSIFLVLLLLSFSSAIHVDFYYGDGCPHCGATDAILSGLSDDYGLNITKYEVSRDPEMRNLLFQKYDDFGADIRQGGVPTIILDNSTFIVGQMSEENWKAILQTCLDEGCPDSKIVFESSLIVESDSAAQLTLPVLVGAALVDSINPCTIAVMVLLISAILYSKGQKSALVSGLLFSFTIFLMYIFYGFGILHAISSFQLTQVFYFVVTVAAFILALFEVRAYFDYRPGMGAVEMPMFLRPYAKKVTANATSPLAVVAAAIFCSLFLVPCSSGPYLLVLGLIAKAVTLQTLSYLLLYNFIFILPMLVITVAIYFGKTTVEKITNMKEDYIREIHLVSGIILYILFFLMLIELVKIL